VFCCTVSKQEELDTGCLLFLHEGMQYYNSTISFAARQYEAKVAIIGNNSVRLNKAVLSFMNTSPV